MRTRSYEFIQIREKCEIFTNCHENMMNFTNITSRPWGKECELFNPMILCRMYQEVPPCSLKETLSTSFDFKSCRDTDNHPLKLADNRTPKRCNLKFFELQRSSDSHSGPSSFVLLRPYFHSVIPHSKDSVINAQLT